jgi:GIY-YIG catalytic domain
MNIGHLRCSSENTQMKQAGIYGIFHRNKKCAYIGLSINVGERLRKHLRNLERGKQEGSYVAMLIDLSGQEIDQVYEFREIELIATEGLTKEQIKAKLSAREIEVGAQYRDDGFELYNRVAFGGTGGGDGVAVVNLDTGEIFETAADAGVLVGKSISAALRDPFLVGDYRWSYVGKEENTAARYAWAASNGCKVGPQAAYPDPSKQPGRYVRWQLMDSLVIELGRLPNSAEAKARGIALGQKASTMIAAYTHWKRYHEFHATGPYADRV